MAAFGLHHQDKERTGPHLVPFAGQQAVDVGHAEVGKPFGHGSDVGHHHTYKLISLAVFSFPGLEKPGQKQTLLFVDKG